MSDVIMPHAILIIDDSATARELIRDTVEETGLFATYYEAANGSEGIDILCHHAVDVVLCDLEMPGMGGLSGDAPVERISAS